MRPHFPAVSSVSIVLVSAFLAASTQARTINDISSIPHRVLQRSISPKFYKSLLKSPLEGLVVVRGQVGSTARLSGYQQNYYGCAVLDVLKSDGTWTHIPSVDSLEGKGLVVRNFRNDSKLVLREVYFFAGFKMGAK